MESYYIYFSFYIKREKNKIFIFINDQLKGKKMEKKLNKLSPVHDKCGKKDCEICKNDQKVNCKARGVVYEV